MIGNTARAVKEKLPVSFRELKEIWNRVLEGQDTDREAWGEGRLGN
jgi:hypothetical protein